MRVFYEFIMGNKHEVLGFKAKLWGPGGKRSNKRSGGGDPSFGDFCRFLIKGVLNPNFRLFSFELNKK